MPPGNRQGQRPTLARRPFVFVLRISACRVCYCGCCRHALLLRPWSFPPTSGPLWHPLQGDCHVSLLPLIAFHRQVFTSFCLQIHKVDTCRAPCTQDVPHRSHAPSKPQVGSPPLSACLPPSQSSQRGAPFVPPGSHHPACLLWEQSL